MFDVSFSELMVIAGVALVVIGPEKLPKVARTAGTIIGRFQRYAAQIQEEVNREARFQDLQKIQQEIQAGVAQGAAAVRGEVDDVIAPVGATEVKPKRKSTPRTKSPVKPQANPLKSTAKTETKSVAKQKSVTKAENVKTKVSQKPKSTKTKSA